eukprot:gene9562-1851_t
MAGSKNWLDLTTNDKVVVLGTFDTETHTIQRGMMGTIEDTDEEYWKVKFDGYKQPQWIFRVNHLMAGVSAKETTGTVDRWKGNYGFGRTYDADDIHFHKKNIDFEVEGSFVPQKGAILAFETEREEKGMSARAIRPLVPDSNSCVGTIVKANSKASIGFIASAQRANDTFFHYSEYQGDGPPKNGMLVSFSVRQGRKNHTFEAYDVRLLTMFGSGDSGQGRGKVIVGTKGGNYNWSKGGKGQGWGKGGGKKVHDDGDYKPYPVPAIEFTKTHSGTIARCDTKYHSGPPPAGTKEDSTLTGPQEDPTKYASDFRTYCDALVKGAALFCATKPGAEEKRYDPATEKLMSRNEFIAKYSVHGDALWNSAKKI